MSPEEVSAEQLPDSNLRVLAILETLNLVLYNFSLEVLASSGHPWLMDRWAVQSDLPERLLVH